MLLGIIDPSSGSRLVLGRSKPLDAAPEIGYLPEERGLYPSMQAREAIAFMGALRGLPIAEGRRRADVLLTNMVSPNGARSRSGLCPKEWLKRSSCLARSSISRG